MDISNVHHVMTRMAPVRRNIRFGRNQLLTKCVTYVTHIENDDYEKDSKNINDINDIIDNH